MFDFIMSQINYTGTALSTSQVEQIVLCGCVLIVVVLVILAGNLFSEVIRRVTGGLRK